jgi:outer membrane protein OmpA-like peptidoglycan-associated protein
MKISPFWLWLCIIILQSGHISAQSAKIKQAQKSKNDLSYPKAIELYEDILKTNKNLNDTERMLVLSDLAYCYKGLQDYKNAYFNYKDFFDHYQKNASPDQVLCYAQTLAAIDKKQESQKYYSLYGQMQSQDLRAKRFSVAYMDLNEYYKDSALYKIKYMEGLNTPLPDFSPMFYKNGLVFVSARNEGKGIKRIFTQNQTPFLDLFWAKTTDLPKTDTDTELGSNSSDDYISEAPIQTQFDANNVEEFSSKINSKYHEGPFTFFKGYNKIIFTRNASNKNSEGIKHLKLYSALSKNGDWSKVEELPFNSDEFSCGHPALSPDNRRLYFASDMPGGYGGTDLYVIDYKDGQWGSPINLGSTINTEGDEMFPYIDANGMMYFASNGHAGLGGLDIFSIETRSGIPYGEVQNFGAPINSSLDDFGLITNANGSSGYFSSNRKKGFADDNIYAFEKGCKTLELLVYDSETQEPLADVELRSFKNGIVGPSYITNTQGQVNICLEKGHDFSFRAEVPGYKNKEVTYATLSASFHKKQSLKMFLDSSLRPLVRGKVISELNGLPVVGATVIITNDLDGSTEELITGQDGYYSFQPIKDGTYSVSVVKEFHAENTKNIGQIDRNLERKAINQNFGMIAEGDIFGLDNVYFDRDKSLIRSDAKKELDDRIIPLMKKNPQVMIELRAHTDSRSSEDYNLVLSEERGLAVKRYLVGKGMNPSQLMVRGVGEAELAETCGGENCSEKIHQLNRRVEFKILTVSGSLTAMK